MLSLVSYIIPRNICKKSPDAARTSVTMTVAQCLYISYVHDSTLLWDLFATLTTSHNVFSVCAKSFTKIDRVPPGMWSACNMPLHNLGMF
jgi:hypothetical protein